MPYIPQMDRVGRTPPDIPKTLGHLAFTSFHEAVILLHDPDVKDDYARRIAIYGCLMGAAQEFWDRHIRDYEDRARERNGDVP